MNDNKLFLETNPELKVSGNKEYKIETVEDSAIFTNKIWFQLLRLYYLIS